MKFLLAAIHAKYIHTGLAVYSLRSYAGNILSISVWNRFWQTFTGGART